MARKLTQKQLAEAPGISPARVCQLKAEGMPVHSVEAALEWRRKWLDPVATSVTTCGCRGVTDDRRGEVRTLKPNALRTGALRETL